MSSGKSFDRFKRDLLLVQIFSWQRHLSITIKVHTALRKPAFLTEQSSFWFALQVFTHRHLISIRRFLQVCLKFPRKWNQTMFFFGSEKKEASPKQTVKVTQPQKRKSTDVLLNQTPNLLSVPKTGRSQSIEKSVHETSERRQISLAETMNDDHFFIFQESPSILRRKIFQSHRIQQSMEVSAQGKSSLSFHWFFLSCRFESSTRTLQSSWSCCFHPWHRFFVWKSSRKISARGLFRSDVSTKENDSFYIEGDRWQSITSTQNRYVDESHGLEIGSLTENRWSHRKIEKILRPEWLGIFVNMSN